LQNEFKAMMLFDFGHILFFINKMQYQTPMANTNMDEIFFGMKKT
jgi:hypothetical protein